MKRCQTKIEPVHQIKRTFASRTLKHLQLVPIPSYSKRIITTCSCCWRCGVVVRASVPQLIGLGSMALSIHAEDLGNDIHRSPTRHSVIEVFFKCLKRFSDENTLHFKIIFGSQIQKHPHTVSMTC